MTTGYEGGYNDMDYDIIEIDMVLNVNSEWYYGKHQRAEDVYGKYESVKAIIL